VRSRDVVVVLVRDWRSPQRLKHKVVHPPNPTILAALPARESCRPLLSIELISTDLQPARENLQASSLDPSACLADRQIDAEGYAERRAPCQSRIRDVV
jgi:hypothetical protein